MSEHKALESVLEFRRGYQLSAEMPINSNEWKQDRSTAQGIMPTSTATQVTAAVSPAPDLAFDETSVDNLRSTSRLLPLIVPFRRRDKYGERYQCYFPGCGVSRTSVSNLSKHFKAHSGAVWDIEKARTMKIFVQNPHQATTSTTETAPAVTYCNSRLDRLRQRASATDSTNDMNMFTSPDTFSHQSALSTSTSDANMLNLPDKPSSISPTLPPLLESLPSHLSPTTPTKSMFSTLPHGPSSTTPGLPDLPRCGPLTSTHNLSEVANIGPGHQLGTSFSENVPRSLKRLLETTGQIMDGETAMAHQVDSAAKCSTKKTKRNDNNTTVKMPPRNTSPAVALRSSPSDLVVKQTDMIGAKVYQSAPIETMSFESFTVRQKRKFQDSLPPPRNTSIGFRVPTQTYGPDQNDTNTLSARGAFLSRVHDTVKEKVGLEYSPNRNVSAFVAGSMMLDKLREDIRQQAEELDIEKQANDILVRDLKDTSAGKLHLTVVGMERRAYIKKLQKEQRDFGQHVSTMMQTLNQQGSARMAQLTKIRAENGAMKISIKDLKASEQSKAERVRELEGKSRSDAARISELGLALKTANSQKKMIEGQGADGVMHDAS